MAKNAPSTTFIYQIVFGLAFLFLAYQSVRIMMFGNMRNVRMIAFFAIAFGVVMWLDKRYWLVLPLCMVLNLKVPGLPFDSTELGCIAITGMHLIRTSLHRDPHTPWNRKVLVAFPLFFWICAIWIMNPVGMHVLGSSTMGGRFYIKIVLGFLAMMCLSGIRLDKSDCRLLFRILVGGAIFSIVMTLFRPSLLNISDEDPTIVRTRYYLLVFAGLYQLIWARYSLLQVFSSLKLFFLVVLSAVSIIASGKRSSTAGIALFPLYRALLTKQYLGRTCIIGAFAFVSLSILVAMDGHFIRLPDSPKRSLALVYSKYRQRGREGFHDTFRTELARSARQVIRKHPWVGRKGFRIDSQEMYWVAGAGHGGMFGGHILAGGWHSAFWAYAADFGIPCLLFYLFFVWQSLKVAFRYSRRIPLGTFQSACFLYYSFLILHNAVLIYTSGHSSMSTQDGMLRLGMLIAIANGFDYEESQNNP